MKYSPRRRLSAVSVGLSALTLALTSCSAVDSSAPDTDSITVITHDSFALSEELLAQFTAETGYEVKLLTQGDAGSLVNQMVLTKDAPLGDVVVGIDNTFASRALAEGVVTTGEVTVSAAAAAHGLPGDDTGALVAVDYGDVCVNVDHSWFAEHQIPEPQNLEDLTSPTYRGLFVTPNPVTSSPGFAFLLTTISAYGDQWPQYWQKLQANEVHVAADWTDAYFTSFSGGGDGDRPIVLSYASSPPFTIAEGETEPATGALLDTCFRQTEYAAVVTGTEHSQVASEFIEFLLSDPVQVQIPETLYMYPVSTEVDLPAAWAQYAPLATDPWEIEPAQISTERESWLNTWSDLAIG